MGDAGRLRALTVRALLTVQALLTFPAFPAFPAVLTCGSVEIVRVEVD